MVETAVREYDLSSLEGIIEALTEIALTSDKPMERLRAIDKIAELKGFKVDRKLTDLTKLQPEQLVDLVESFVKPMLAPFKVRVQGSELIELDD